MTSKNILNGTGWFLIMLYWGMMMLGQASGGQIGLLIITMFVPFLAIPMGILINLFVNPLVALICIIWLLVGFYLISRED